MSLPPEFRIAADKFHFRSSTTNQRSIQGDRLPRFGEEVRCDDPEFSVRPYVLAFRELRRA